MPPQKALKPYHLKVAAKLAKIGIQSDLGINERDDQLMDVQTNDFGEVRVS